MDSTIEHVETDITVDFELVANEAGHLVEPSDSDIEFRAHAREEDAGQLLAGSADAAAVGPRTDADVYQAVDRNVGHVAAGFAARGEPAVTPPSVASEAIADCRATVHSTLYPVEVAYYGLHPSASGAMATDHGDRTGSESGGFVDPCSPRQSVERVVTSNLVGVIPTTTGARTSTTTTITSTYVTCSTVGGSAYVQNGRMPPSVGLTSVRPAQQVFVSQLQFVELLGSFPRARDSLGTLFPEFENLGTNWVIRSPIVTFRPSSTDHKLPVGLVIGL